MEDKETFRDSIATVTDEGKRAWIYPKKPSGNYYKYRSYVSYALLTFLFVAPFIKVNGNQFLLFNVIERRFSIFGFPFWPQDFYLVVLSMIISIVFLTLFTVAFGRIFCGWICPQTIFMEMVFRRIEFWIEGDRNKQRKLANQEWNAEKIRKRLLKWSIFFLISFLVANIFLAYIISSDKLIIYIKEGMVAHIDTLIPLLIFTSVFYFIFTWFREQVCIIACPYGRLQGVLMDDQSVIVAYDYKRGEKEKGRARFSRREDRATTGKGDCVDCGACVHVCPTGIDIRNGTQLECINCTACIDECDAMMDKVGMERGLIRYASIENIEKKKPFRFTARMKGYTAVLTILIGILIGLLFLRNDIEANVVKLSGQLYETKANGIIRNVYNYKIINKTTKEVPNVTYKVLSHKGGSIKVVGKDKIVVPAQGLTEGILFIDLHKASIGDARVKVKIGVYSGDKLIETTSTNFLGPRSFR